MNTTVVNIYHKVPYDVYIGRAGHGDPGYFGNPFTGTERDQNVKNFKDYFHDRLKRDIEFRKRVEQLRGKVLGCFCKPRPCHGDVIADYVNNLPEPNPMKYAVIGSRSFSDYSFLEKILNWYDIKTIISGGAKGADSFARIYGNKNGIPVKEFLPNWDLYGKSAGFHRNKNIIAECDEVIAFWDGASKGTSHSIKLANESMKPVHIYWPQPKDDIANLGL